MIVCRWEDLPKEMQTEEVRPYWEILNKKKFALICKRIFDFVASSLMLILFSPIIFLISIAIKFDSSGPVFYRQERITQYGRKFRIHKFRSMCDGADKKGSLVTVNGDNRVTKVGRFIRKFKLDEISQLIDIWVGDMSYVGTRPEVQKYVDKYTEEMKATLLLPAGVTSTASIEYRNENDLLDVAEDVDKVYVEVILPIKMKMNLDDIRNFSFWREIGLCFKTVGKIFTK